MATKHSTVVPGERAADCRDCTVYVSRAGMNSVATVSRGSVLLCSLFHDHERALAIIKSCASLCTYMRGRYLAHTPVACFP